VFQVQTSIYLTVDGSTSAGDLQAGNVYIFQKAPTYANLVDTTSILREAVERLDDGTTISELRSSVTASAREQTGIISGGSGADERRGCGPGLPDRIVSRAAVRSGRPVCCS
jgi:capsular polysaccharide biosynthesis protein